MALFFTLAAPVVDALLLDPHFTGDLTMSSRFGRLILYRLSSRRATSYGGFMVLGIPPWFLG